MCTRVIDKSVYRDCETKEAWKEVLEERYSASEWYCLDLSDCKLSDKQGIPLFDYLCTRPLQFQMVNLDGNLLTDKTAKKIADVMLKIPCFCNGKWLGNMIKLGGNPISAEGLRACYAAIKKTDRLPDSIAFSYNELISAQEWRALNAEHLEMRKTQDPIVRLFSWLNSFMNLSR